MLIIRTKNMKYEKSIFCCTLTLPGLDWSAGKCQSTKGQRAKGITGLLL